MTTSIIKKKGARESSIRSRSGCLTCRSRHIKCDETGPICRNCIKSNKVCERGARLNFLKCMVVKPPRNKHSTKVIKDYTFMDQSFSIHKIYRADKFHDYSSWLKHHSELELLESDIDIQEAQFGRPIRETSASSRRNRLKQRTMLQYHSSENSPNIQQTSEDYSDSDINSTKSASPTPMATINKLISVVQSRNIDRSLFIYSEQEPSKSYSTAQYYRPDFNNQSEHLTLSDIEKIIDYLESHDFTSFNKDRPVLELDFALLLSSLVTSLKLKKLDGLFQESYLSSKIISYINEALKLEEHQTYDNLMNYFELLLLDLNNSLMLKKPMKIKINNENTEFLLKKIVSWSLFDDLNYFLIKIIILLMKLNNLYHRPQADAHQIQLTSLLNEFKALEDNQFISAFLPRVSNHSVSSSSSHSTNTNRSVSDTSSSLSINPPRVEFQNLKIRRLHIFYNFTLLFILKKFRLKHHLRAFIFKQSFLSNFWVSFESDISQRLAYLSSDYDNCSDPFINFINKRTL